jgi:hypothetical protein
MPANDTPYWERLPFLLAIVVAMAIPLMLPQTPPLVDLPGHLGRYRVQLDLDTSASLQRFFEFEWRLIGNLGVDLLVIPVSQLFGLELAVKIIVLTIPPLTSAGILWTAYEVHGRVPPTALFALPFVYSFPFNFGFLNFSLAMGIALLGLALWIRLGRTRQPVRRALFFVPFSVALWTVHAFGWGLLGLTAWSAELIRQRDEGRTWPIAALRAILHALVLSLPLALMVMWRSGDVDGMTSGFFDVSTKAFSLVAVMRDRWLLWDSLGLAVAFMLIGIGIVERRFEFARKLIVPALALAAVYFVMPTHVFGSAYADMRLAPMMVILAVVAMRPPSDEKAATNSRIALLGIVFIAVRLAGSTVSFLVVDGENRERLEAITAIPFGARVLFLAGDECDAAWPLPKYAHLGAFVITRRMGFTNQQWQIQGAQLLRVNYPPARNFTSDPTQIIYPKNCMLSTRRERGFHPDQRTTEEALAQFPRDGFDFVWMIRPPEFKMIARPGLQPMWRGRDSILYRIQK